MNVVEKIVEHSPALADASTKVAYSAGVGSAVYGGFTLNEWGVIIGIGGVVVTYLTNLVFRVIEHRMRVRRMRALQSTDTDLGPLR